MSNPSTQRSPQTEAAATIGGVRTDLAEIAGELPVGPHRAEHVARILDRLAEEIGQAAHLMRQVTS
jgi:hypothetical protein